MLVLCDGKGNNDFGRAEHFTALQTQIQFSNFSIFVPKFKKKRQIHRKCDIQIEYVSMISVIFFI